VTLAQVARVGLGGVGANTLFTLAAGRGLLAIVSVLGSVYPVATVILAHIVLGERITRTAALRRAARSFCGCQPRRQRRLAVASRPLIGPRRR